MKKCIYTTVLMLAGCLLVTLPAQAGGPGHHAERLDTHHPGIEKRIDRRQDRQHGRIMRGLDRGDLSRHQAKRRMRDQKRLARMERRFERDGYYSPHERRKMGRALNRASDRISDAHAYAVRPHGRHHHGRKRQPIQRIVVEQPVVYYPPPEETYAPVNSSSASIHAESDGFSISWSRSRQF